MPARPTLLLLVFLFPVLLEPAGTPAQKLRPARPVSKKVAAEALKDFKKTYKSRDDRMRLAAVDGLTTLKHPQIAKQLGRTLLRDRSTRVRVAAATRLGMQDRKSAMRPLLAAFKSRDNEKRTDVVVAVLAAWRSLGKPPPFRVLVDNWDRKPKEVQQGIIQTAALHRNLKTVEWLAKLLDAPIPANPDSPTNPPAAYWKRKLTRWRFWIDQVHDAISDLTDEDFESSSEVAAWIKGGGKIVVHKKKGR